MEVSNSISKKPLFVPSLFSPTDPTPALEEVKGNIEYIRWIRDWGQALRILDLKRIKELKDSKHGYPEREGNLALRNAAAAGNLELVELLLGNTIQEEELEGLLEVASKKGWFLIVERLLKEPKIKADLSILLKRAVRLGQSELIPILFKDPSLSLQEVAVSAAVVHNDPAFLELILSDKRVRIDAYALQGAVKRLNLSMVKRLLGDPRLPEIDREVLTTAFELKCLSMCELLLKDERVIPSPKTLLAAARAGWAPIFKELLSRSKEAGLLSLVPADLALGRFPKELAVAILQDPRCHITLDGLQAAIVRGDLELLDLCLKGLKETKQLSSALALACKYGNLEVVRRLLQDPRFDPAATFHMDEDSLSHAALYGHLEVVKEILADVRLQGPVQQDKVHSELKGGAPVLDRALELSIIGGNIEIYKLLTSSKRVQNRAQAINQGLKACQEENMLLYLLEEEKALILPETTEQVVKTSVRLGLLPLIRRFIFYDSRLWSFCYQILDFADVRGIPSILSSPYISPVDFSFMLETIGSKVADPALLKALLSAPPRLQYANMFHSSLKKAIFYRAHKSVAMLLEEFPSSYIFSEEKSFFEELILTTSLETAQLLIQHRDIQKLSPEAVKGVLSSFAWTEDQRVWISILSRDGKEEERGKWIEKMRASIGAELEEIPLDIVDHLILPHVIGFRYGV